MRGGRGIPGNFRSRLTFGFRFGKVKMPPCHRPRMDPRIRNLPSTTFCGERLSRRAIAEIQETVQFFPELSRTELVRTVCVQMDWHTPGGSARLGFGLRVLGELQRRGIVQLPPKRGAGRGPQKPLQFDRRTAPQPPLREPLAQLVPVRLEPATEAEEAALWNQWVERYHPQGYRQPIGAHLRYWVRDGRGRLLGCLLFDFATRRLPCRDRFIGWEGQAFRERLHLVVRNARYLLFEWVQVENLASHVLGLAARQLPRDWERWHGWRPVLLETYVNPRQHQAACYRAANWQLAGRTQARGARGQAPAKRPKEVYLLPLHPHWKRILLEGPRPRPPPRTTGAGSAGGGRSARCWWCCSCSAWPARRASGATAGSWPTCGSAAGGWAWNCRSPARWRPRRCARPGPRWVPPCSDASTPPCCGMPARTAPRCGRGCGPSPSTAPSSTCPGSWCSKATPRPRRRRITRRDCSAAYQIGRRLPCDFALHPHRDERRAALQHLAVLGPGDLVVYDRGYYSIALLQAHTDRQVAAVFRLKRNASGRVRDFVAGSSCDEVVSVEPTETAHCRLPAADLTPCRLRLVKYAINNTVYALGTTLLDAERYPAAELADLYHGRWSVEELYKISKELLEIESFHSRSERTVKQELYAHFTLIAMARLFASRCERQFESRVEEAGRPPLLANFNHSLGAVERELEGLLLHQAPQRRSRRPSKKWRNRKPADPQTKD